MLRVKGETVPWAPFWSIANVESSIWTLRVKALLLYPSVPLWAHSRTHVPHAHQFKSKQLHVFPDTHTHTHISWHTWHSCLLQEWAWFPLPRPATLIHTLFCTLHCTKLSSQVKLWICCADSHPHTRPQMFPETTGCLHLLGKILTKQLECVIPELYKLRKST